MDEFEAEFSLADELKMVIRGFYEDRMIAQAELGILDVLPDDPFPMPNTCHPHYEGHAEWVRKNGDPVRRPHVNVVKSVSVRHSMKMAENLYPTAALSTNKTLLTAKKFAAPMPFIGDPRSEQAVYFWWAWLDDLGRHIATDSTIVWRYK